MSRTTLGVRIQGESTDAKLSVEKHEDEQELNAHATRRPTETGAAWPAGLIPKNA